MDIAESIGFIQFWGLTPSANLLKKDPADLCFLVSGSGDIRHMLRTLSESSLLESPGAFTFYLQESSREVLARHLLFIYLINDLSLPIRERVELFLEIYGNSLIRERTAEYISQAGQALIRIITQHKASGELKEIFDFSCLKFKERDELEEVFRSWGAEVEFDIVGLRDQRLRFHYKERYDHRDNLTDWDYHWGLKELAPQINYRHYRDWRRSGVAYEYRLASYNSANKTLSSYIPGKKKITKDSVLVRGFWADIVNSPYWAFGLQVNCCEECTEILNKIANVDRVHHEGDISDFNLSKMLTQMETFNEYHFPPEKDKMRAYRKFWSGEPKEEGGETKVEEVKEEEKVEEVSGNVEGLLPEFRRRSVKVVPIMDSVQIMSGKRRFQGIFDRVVVGGISSVENAESVAALSKESGVISIEGLSNIVVIKKDEKDEITRKMREIAEQAGWTAIGTEHSLDFIKKRNENL